MIKINLIDSIKINLDIGRKIDLRQCKKIETLWPFPKSLSIWLCIQKLKKSNHFQITAIWKISRRKTSRQCTRPYTQFYELNTVLNRYKFCLQIWTGVGPTLPFYPTLLPGSYLEVESKWQHWRTISWKSVGIGEDSHALGLVRLMTIIIGPCSIH